MIRTESKLLVSDNSGAKTVKCIRVINSKNYNVGSIGDIILVRVVKKNHAKRVKKKLLYFGLIIMVKNSIIRQDGTVVKFNNNRVLLFSNSHKFLGSRIYSPLAKEIRSNLRIIKKEKQKYLKIFSYSLSLI